MLSLGSAKPTRQFSRGAMPHVKQSLRDILVRVFPSCMQRLRQTFHPDLVRYTRETEHEASGRTTKRRERESVRLEVFLEYEWVCCARSIDNPAGGHHQRERQCRVRTKPVRGGRAQLACAGRRYQVPSTQVRACTGQRICRKTKQFRQLISSPGDLGSCMSVLARLQ